MIAYSWKGAFVKGESMLAPAGKYGRDARLIKVVLLLLRRAAEAADAFQVQAKETLRAVHG